MSATHGPVRILHLEDNPRDAELVLDLLESDDLACDLRRVGTRQEYEEALSISSFDLVLADYSVPGYDGMSALQFARSKDPALPLIVISGSIGEDAAVQCLRSGATDYLLKDRLDRLPSAVRRALQSADAERKRCRAEEALRISEERFALVAQATSDAIWDWDLRTGQFWWGGQVEAFIGRQANFVSTERPPWCDRVHPDDLVRVREKLGTAIEGAGAEWTDEHRLRRQDGSYAIVATRAYILRDAGGEPIRIVGGMTDITGRKHAEERFEAMFHASPLAIAFENPEGRILDGNARFFQLFAYRREEMVGRSSQELGLWAKPEQRQRAFDASRAGAPLRNVEWDFRRKTGECGAALVSGEVLLLGGEPILLLMVVDVTERKALQAQLQRMQRVESVGRLASGIAHDMNNILAPIMMSAPLLRLGLSEAESGKILTTIETSALRGAALVRQLLIFGRGVEGERRPITIDVIVEDVVRISRQTFPKGIPITTKVSADVWSVHGDATQLRQVLLNLCVNARDAMPDGGQLMVSAHNVEIDALLAAGIPEARPGKYVTLRVTDNGTGIPSEIADRIFDPFFSTKGEGNGTGLGLSTVLGIVKSHGGFIRQRSAVGRGTTFEVYLPAGFGEDESPPADAAGIEARRGRGELILVVDDEEAIRSVLRDTLVRHGYSVITAPNGVEASAAFTESPGVQLVVVDLEMPLMDGVSLARVLRQLDPAVRFVVSTGQAEPSGAGSRRKELQAFGVRSVLTKPYPAVMLLRAVREALDERAPAVLSNVATGDLTQFEAAIRERYGCNSRHHSSMMVTESHAGKSWTGQVEVWALSHHPRTEYCYAWREGDGTILTVLQVPPVISPQSAVRRFLQTG